MTQKHGMEAVCTGIVAGINAEQNTERGDSYSCAALSATSRETGFRFVCPECGSHRLAQQIGTLKVCQSIEGVTESGHISWGAEEAGGNGAIIYSCQDCDYIPEICEFDDADELDDEMCMALWLKENGEEIEVQPAKDREVPIFGSAPGGNLYEFTCPNCGGHQLMKYFHGTYEVTPVEYVDDCEELVFGSMTLEGGESGYGCGACDYELQIEQGAGLEEGKALAKWLKDNCCQS